MFLIRNKMRAAFLIFTGILLFANCRQDKTVVDKPNITTDTPLTVYNIDVPYRFSQPLLPAYNPLTVEGVELGRKLFYDTILSTNGRTCSFCHPQAKSFTTTYTDLGLDPALYQQFGNIPMFCNEAWNPAYGWIGEFPDMDHIAVADLNGQIFFNTNIPNLITKLKASPYYSYMFRRVFPGQDIYQPGVIQEKVAFALAQFVRTIVVNNSKFDKKIKGLAVLTQSEGRGYDIFMNDVQNGGADCFHCHNYPLWTDNAFHNTGLDSTFVGINRGRNNMTGLSKDMGLFRTPTLRNVSLTAPYMHDGRFKTLDEVIEQYNSGVHKSATLDPIMTLPGKEMGLGLSTMQKNDLKAFLLTLTDSTILTNPNYGRIK